MDRNSTVYLDYAATTPVDRRVFEKMQPYFNLAYGNPSSVHTFGQQAEDALETAREQVAEILNCTGAEVVFTSCGTESDNLALRGMAFAACRQRSARHILISPVEHHAVSRTAEQLAEWFDFELEVIPVDQYGQVAPAEVSARLRPDTAVVSVMHANNEIGSINPIAAIGEICRQRQVPFHTDSVQAAAWLPVDVQQLNVDLLSLGGHKFYGPKGVGALYVRNGLRLLPMQTGGGQEHNLRAGTSNIPYIVGFAEALRLAQVERAERTTRVQSLRDELIGRVLAEIPGAALTGHPVQRLPNHASFVFSGVDGNQLLIALDLAGFACSSGSACKTGNPAPSEVLLAMGIAPELALGSLRVTLGSGTTPEDIERFTTALPAAIRANRGR